jgi:phage repressor protein C with HTH and peptisase S24 domain
MRTGGDVPNLVMTSMEDDSMAPSLVQHGVFIYDKSKQDLQSAKGVWVIKIGALYHVTRVQQLDHSRFQATFDNSRYTPIPLEEPYEVVGKVVWSDRQW